MPTPASQRSGVRPSSAPNSHKAAKRDHDCMGFPCGRGWLCGLCDHRSQEEYNRAMQMKDEVPLLQIYRLSAPDNHSACRPR
jgi:hypothetical protein